MRAQGDALDAIARHLGPTLRRADVLTGFGHFAAVLRLSADLALAICTDGVGSKTMVAAALDRFDTIGFDCVAMNVNDLLCVGARPRALVDYLGVNRLDAGRAEAVLRGLGEAAEEAGIAVVGGEIAELPEIIGPGEPRALDLVGTAVGTLHPDRVIRGDAVAPGDALIGISSSGIHSNGLTLARRALLGSAGLRLDERVGPLERPLGEELLTPTLIYVRPVLALWDAAVPTHGLAHITGGGFANLCRLNARVGFLLDDLPEPPAIFRLIAGAGEVSAEEMYTVFNMGVGLVVAVPASEAAGALEVVASSGFRARRIGRVTEERGVVRLEGPGVVLSSGY